MFVCVCVCACVWRQVWRLNSLKLKINLAGHTAYVSTVTVSPDGSLCASGGKDKVRCTVCTVASPAVPSARCLPLPSRSYGSLLVLHGVSVWRKRRRAYGTPALVVISRGAGGRKCGAGVVRVWLPVVQVAMLWDLNEGKRLYSLDAGSAIHALVFSPNRYWLCAATDKCIKARGPRPCWCTRVSWQARGRARSECFGGVG
jgi:hypothetical protein